MKREYRQGTHDGGVQQFPISLAPGNLVVTCFRRVKMNPIRSPFSSAVGGGWEGLMGIMKRVKNNGINGTTSPSYYTFLGF